MAKKKSEKENAFVKKHAIKMSMLDVVIMAAILTMLGGFIVKLFMSAALDAEAIEKGFDNLITFYSLPLIFVVNVMIESATIVLFNDEAK